MSKKEALIEEIERQKQYLVEQTDLAKGILDRSLMAIREDIKKLQTELDNIISEEDNHEQGGE